MRFHVLGLPHTQTTRAYVHCAYTEKIRKFCDMMMSLGHEVFLYASEDNEANCTEFITCITKEEQKQLIGVEGPLDNHKVEFNPSVGYWSLFNSRAAYGISERLEDKDFICITAGLCQQEVAQSFPDTMSVEIGIGYGGTFAKYRVFESYAWMHTVYGAQAGDPHSADGNYFNAVIPNYYDVADFPFSETKDDYFLFIGRLIDRKGFQVALEVCRRLGKRLVVAGQGEAPEYGEYVGVVDAQKRGELMSRAQAVFVPTQYIEPFGGVAAEAMLCGTPVITSDWGAFTENVVQAVTGYRCYGLNEYLWAAEYVKELNPYRIREYAVNKFSMDVVKYQYHNYFLKLLTLYGEGWYTISQEK